jgi:branched-chain amino acid aminotransferase
MHKVALLNGKLIDADDASLSALSAAALYGRGVFTTVAICDGKPFLIDKHLRRLGNNAKAIGLPNSEKTLAELESHLNELIRLNSFLDGRARITFFDATASGMWANKSEERVDCFIVTAGSRHVPAELNLTVSPYPINSRSPLVGIKACNYLENLISKHEAGARGFDEAVRSNERGEVTSACMANLFWLKGDQLFTPSLDTGCLAGTTREFVLENFDCREITVEIDELRSADSIFISSAGIGIRQVQSLDERVFARSTYPLLDLVTTEHKKTRMSAE